MSHLHTELGVARQKVQEMLNSEPEDLDLTNILFQSKLKPIEVILFEKYWLRVERHTPIWDMANAEYDEWTNTRDYMVK